MFYNENEFFEEGGPCRAGRPSSCAFTGHHPAKSPLGLFWRRDPRCLALKRRIRDAVESAYEEATVTSSAVWPRAATSICEIVLALRAKHPEVTLEAAVPCPTQPRRVT